MHGWISSCLLGCVVRTDLRREVSLQQLVHAHFVDIFVQYYCGSSYNCVHFTAHVCSKSLYLYTQMHVYMHTVYQRVHLLTRIRVYI